MSSLSKQPPRSRPFPPALGQVAVLFLLLTAAIAGVAYRYHVAQRDAIEHEVKNQLLAIADMKVKDIAEWRSQRLGEVRTLQASPVIMGVMERVAAGKADEATRNQLVAWLETWCREMHYANAILTDQQGTLILTAGKLLGDERHIRELARGVIDTGEMALRDFHLEGPGGVVHLGLNVPLRLPGASRPFGALLLAIAPTDYLYPLLREWPVPSRTAATVLVRRDGQEVVFLNDLRDPSGGMNVKVPLSRTRLAAVQAVLGRVGNLEAVDYRGVPVFAAARPVPGTAWVLVTHEDADEVRAPIVRRSIVVGLLAVSLIFGAGAWAVVLWRRQQLQSYRARYQAELDRRALVGHYDYLTRYANDMILLLDAETGRIVQANDKAVATYGYTSEELQGMTIRDLRHPSDIESFDRQLTEARERGSLVFETVHRSRDGRPLPVEVSTRLIEVDQKRFTQSIIRDISERRALDERLRRTLGTLSTVVEASPAAIISLSRDLAVTTWSKAAEQMFGWTAQEAIGGPLPIVHERCQGLFHHDMQQVLAGQTVEGRRTEAGRRDGTSVPISASSAPLRDPQGQVTGAVLILVDITERRRADEALEQSEARFRATFDQAAMGMNHTLLDGTYVRVNQRYCDITGYPREELLGRKFWDIVHPEDAPMEIERTRRLREGEIASYATNLRYIRKNGSIAWVYVTVSLLRDAAGQPVHRIAAIEDVTERVRAEEALRQSEERFRQVVVNAPDGIAVLSGGLFRYLSPAALRMFGATSAAQLLGQPLLDRIHPDDQADVVRRLAAIGSENSQVPAIERRCLRLDGEAFAAEVSAVSVEFDHQPAALAFLHDITARKRAEEERAHLERQLRQAQKMESVGRLAGGVAHDFNNHLTVINGYCDMLLRDFAADQALCEGLQEIRAAGDRAAALTQQLLAFSRKQLVEPKPLDLNDVVDEAGKMLRRLIGEDVAIITKLEPRLGWVMADRGQIHQVLMNLTVNARDAMPQGGKIFIETSNHQIDQTSPCQPDAKPGPYVMLSVSDTGIGMSQETMQQIFEPFFTTKEVASGTGLGLATVHGIVHQAGGWIRVASRPGEGATFEMCFPRTEEPAETPAIAPSAVEARQGAETVLVVEDQAEVRRLALSILRRDGYRLLEAADGAEALALAEQFAEPIDLLVTDVVMPGISGRELADRLVALRPALKVLYMSGYTGDIIDRQGLLQPGVAYLPKPFAPADFSAKVQEVLSRQAPGGRILIIDDEPGVRNLLKQVLVDGGYEVFTAPDGLQGVQLVADHHVQVVITDLVMPEQEGLETIRQLRSRHPEVRIVAMSGAFGGKFLKSAAMLGAHQVLSKPVDTESLLAMVRELLNGQDA